MMWKLRLLCCYFFIILNTFSRGEIFTATSDIEPLLTTHKRVLDDLYNYITLEEDRIRILKRLLEVYKREHVKAMEDIPNYLGNPINAFTLIKRMTIDLELVQLNVDLGAGKYDGKVEHASNIVITTYENTTYPSAGDLRGAVRALTRLQETYLLKVEDLAEGIICGVSYGSAMNSDDCFELGKALYYDLDYSNSLSWMSIALRKYNEENFSYPFSEVDILEYICFAHYFLGNVTESEEWMKKLVTIDPTLAVTTDKLEEKRKKLQSDAGRDFAAKNGEVYTPEDIITNEELDLYQTLCRGEIDISPVVAKELTCRYLTETHPFLRLAPIKMEYKYRDPDIVLFHEVLSEDEIEHLKELAQPRFRRATAYELQSGEIKPVDYRISKAAWLTDADSPVVERVTRRVADFTGLDMGTAEHLQVANYGIGGHYIPHYDYPTLQDVQFPDEVGNRIATVIFYMSDVAQGGATVFTELGLSLFPVRGSAAMWFNLHASGEGDLATRHAACPVLRGSKWVSTKWIHLVGQEFRKPCGLEYQSEDMERPLNKPITKNVNGGCPHKNKK